jgi:hypothetical protein
MACNAGDLPVCATITHDCGMIIVLLYDNDSAPQLILGFNWNKVGGADGIKTGYNVR